MAVALIVVAALVVGAVVGFVLGRARRRPARPALPRPGETPPDRVMPGAVLRSIPEQMELAVVVLDVSSDVAFANSAVRQMGVVRGGHLIVEDLHRLARVARETGEHAQVLVDLPDSRLGREPLAVSAHVAPLDSSGYVALFLRDVTESQRLAAVRRDFVANVSHELKTPVGAMTLLAEAMQDASDDPEAVRRFAARMQQEGGRLGRLVQELIELSRLQGADPLPSSTTVVPVDRLVAEAVEATHLAAETAGISVVAGGDRRLAVRGDATQLLTALVNLVGNAVAYSPPGTRVAVGSRLRSAEDSVDGDHVEISVTDQGIGIAESDLERIFERFYRADPARSRATGGTGLGLAIVKHIATNHGGSVRVWSVEGSGSTFTLRLPAAGNVVAVGNTPESRMPESRMPESRMSANSRMNARTFSATAGMDDHRGPVGDSPSESHISQAGRSPADSWRGTA
ncbi:MAG TPA: ATP-binding protein [Mycobacteriales bacterium]|nr:ATP-binding protein [Mycobacteriales bacterium]